jgi:tetratricopeptide (TPR) repeat protein
MELLVALALMADVGVAHHGPRVRPVECNVLPGERGANVWERAKVPELRRYCDLLASASAKLAPGSQMVAEVVALADQADGLVPGRPAPMVLKGRALCQLARHADALVALRAARSRDDHALDDPAVLLAWARSLAFTGETDEAHAAYRTLLPRAEALPLADRGVAYLGAGMLAMSLGPAGVDESVAILRQARHDSQDLLRAAATFALALALDRAGDAGEATAVLAEEGPDEAASVMAEGRVLEAMGKAGHEEAQAILALALDAAGKHEAARAAWRAYLTDGAEGGTWSAHAHAHLGHAPRSASAARHP